MFKLVIHLSDRTVSHNQVVFDVDVSASAVASPLFAHCDVVDLVLSSVVRRNPCHVVDVAVVNTQIRK